MIVEAQGKLLYGKRLLHITLTDGEFVFYNQIKKRLLYHIEKKILLSMLRGLHINARKLNQSEVTAINKCIEKNGTAVSPSCLLLNVVDAKKLISKVSACYGVPPHIKQEKDDIGEYTPPLAQTSFEKTDNCAQDCVQSEIEVKKSKLENSGLNVENSTSFPHKLLFCNNKSVNQPPAAEFGRVLGFIKQEIIDDEQGSTDLLKAGTPSRNKVSEYSKGEKSAECSEIQNKGKAFYNSNMQQKENAQSSNMSNDKERNNETFSTQSSVLANDKERNKEAFNAQSSVLANDKERNKEAFNAQSSVLANDKERNKEAFSTQCSVLANDKERNKEAFSTQCSVLANDKERNKEAFSTQYSVLANDKERNKEAFSTQCSVLANGKERNKDLNEQNSTKYAKHNKEAIIRQCSNTKNDREPVSLTISKQRNCEIKSSLKVVLSPLKKQPRHSKKIFPDLTLPNGVTKNKELSPLSDIPVSSLESKVDKKESKKRTIENIEDIPKTKAARLDESYLKKKNLHKSNKTLESKKSHKIKVIGSKLQKSSFISQHSKYDSTQISKVFKNEHEVIDASGQKFNIGEMCINGCNIKFFVKGETKYFSKHHLYQYLLPPSHGLYGKNNFLKVVDLYNLHVKSFTVGEFPAEIVDKSQRKSNKLTFISENSLTNLLTKYLVYVHKKKKKFIPGLGKPNIANTSGEIIRKLKEKNASEVNNVNADDQEMPVLSRETFITPETIVDDEPPTLSAVQMVEVMSCSPTKCDTSTSFVLKSNDGCLAEQPSIASEVMDLTIPHLGIRNNNEEEKQNQQNDAVLESKQPNSTTEYNVEEQEKLKIKLLRKDIENEVKSEYEKVLNTLKQRIDQLQDERDEAFSKLESTEKALHRMYGVQNQLFSQFCSAKKDLKNEMESLFGIK